MLLQSSPLNGLRILVVDSDPDSTSLLTLIFQSDGVEILVATSVSEALEILKQTKPDLLISELRLPGEDGYSLIRKIRAIELEQRIQLPVIALTTSVSDDDYVESLTAGFCKHLPKPFEIDELIEVVANIARQFQPLNQDNHLYFYPVG